MSEELIPAGEGGVVLAGGSLTGTGYQLRPGAGFEEWEQDGETLGLMGRSCQWWTGDWINEGERAWGQKYTQAIEATGLEYNLLSKYAWVARQVCNRLQSLSWAHHHEVAKLESEAQEVWLLWAEFEGWSVRELRQQIRAITAQETPPLPSGEFAVIVADPPWQYDEGWPEYADEAGGEHRRLDLPYQSMPIEAIKGLEVPAASDAHLFLWTTNRYLRDAFEVLEGWGFEFSQVLTWCKPPRGIGPGGIFSNTTEFVVYGRRGKPSNGKRTDSSWWEWPRGRHSAKPQPFLELIESMCEGPFLEMFSRAPREGWETWGLEA